MNILTIEHLQSMHLNTANRKIAETLMDELKSDREAVETLMLLSKETVQPDEAVTSRIYKKPIARPTERTELEKRFARTMLSWAPLVPVDPLAARFGSTLLSWSPFPTAKLEEQVDHDDSMQCKI